MDTELITIGRNLITTGLAVKGKHITLQESAEMIRMSISMLEDINTKIIDNFLNKTKNGKKAEPL